MDYLVEINSATMQLLLPALLTFNKEYCKTIQIDQAPQRLTIMINCLSLQHKKKKKYHNIWHW